MEASQLLTFVLLATGIILVPGPNVMVIVSSSLHAGWRRGLVTVLGTQLAMVIQLLVAGLSTAWFLSLLSDGLKWLKWLGVAYLLYLGISALWRVVRGQRMPVPTALGSLQQGFWVSLTNPKTILFFSAFLPQFVTDPAAYAQQITLLSGIFLLLALVLDSIYALVAGRVRHVFYGPNIDRLQNGASGALYIVASAWLARSRAQ